MTAAIVNAEPFIPVRPIIKVTLGANSVEFECAAESFEIGVDQDESTTETFCGAFTSNKAEVWTITGTLFTSYGANGLWNNLRPMVGKAGTTFEFLPDAGAAQGPTNPKMSGACRVKAFPFYTGSLGESTSFDVVIAVQGTPAFSESIGPDATGATAGLPGTYVPVGATPPADAADATSNGVVATPTTAWTSGQYAQGTVAGTAGEFHWNGTAWAAGRA